MIRFYLFRGSPWQILLWFLLMMICTLGGWLITTHAFRVEKRSRLILGFGVGVACYVWFSNILGHWLPPMITFITAALLVLVLGFVYAVKGTRPLFDWSDLSVWPVVVMGLLLTLLYAREGAGMGILDEEQNASIISTMGAGDIPPHYYLNSQVYLLLHYGFHLIGASMMQIGGLFPWSAFDLSKAIVFGLTVMLAYLVGRRYLDLKHGGVAMALMVLFSGGTRYLLLLIPTSLLVKIDPQITLIGNSASLGVPLSEALLRGWPLSSGPPIPYPFAFMNGIHGTLAYSHAGPGTFSVAMLLLILLLATRSEKLLTTPVFVILLSTWGFTWETDYALFAVGVIVIWLLFRLRSQSLPEEFKPVFLGLAMSIPVVLFQGGVFTGTAASILQSLNDSTLGGATAAISATGFSFRIPPAILSSHLGPLHLTSPSEMVIAISEIGPVILFAPWITWWAWRRSGEAQWLNRSLLVSAWVGFLLPIFLAYTFDRDTSRFMGFGLTIWKILLVQMVWHYSGRWVEQMRLFGSTAIGLMVFGGVVVAGIGLTSLTQSMIAEGITKLDAQVSADTWDVLPQDSEVFDPRDWRATLLTGRLTRANRDSGYNEPLPEWEALEEDPSVEGMLAAGFEFVYYDDYWWDRIPLEARMSLSSDCVQIVSEHTDEMGAWRRLVDLRGCTGLIN